MESIERITDFVNMGGLSHIFFTPIDNVLSLAVRYNTYMPSIEFKPNCNWLKFYYVSETAGVKQVKKTGKQGEYFEASLTAIHPTQRQVSEHNFELMDGKEFILVFRDQNGILRMLGTLDEPCLFTTESETGQKVADRSQSQFAFSAILSQRMPFCSYTVLQDTNINPGEGEGEVEIQFG